MLAKLFSPETMPFSLPVLIALGLTLIVFLLFRGTRRKPADPALAKAGAKSSWVMQQSTWEKEQSAASDRRSSLRREGTPVKIVATSPAFEDSTSPGYVLDRSTGGLKVALQAGMAPGSSLQLRASHAPETTPWVTVIVRNCVDSGDHYILGCEFEKTPPWNVLLLFG